MKGKIRRFPRARRRVTKARARRPLLPDTDAFSHGIQTEFESLPRVLNSFRRAARRYTAYAARSAIDASPSCIAAFVWYSDIRARRRKCLRAARQSRDRKQPDIQPDRRVRHCLLQDVSRAPRRRQIDARRSIVRRRALRAKRSDCSAFPCPRG